MLLQKDASAYPSFTRLRRYDTTQAHHQANVAEATIQIDSRSEEALSVVSCRVTSSSQTLTPPNRLPGLYFRPGKALETCTKSSLSVRRRFRTELWSLQSQEGKEHEHRKPVNSAIRER